jgi:hypothetical protein
MAQARGRDGEHVALEVARDGWRGGGAFATLISAFALIFSGFSFYESVLKVPELSIYVPPQIAYTDPDRPDDPFEVFIVPLTIANDGARTGTVLSIELKVTNPRSSASKQFYAARLGPWSADPLRPFAPLSLAGRASFSGAVQFFPRVGEKVPRILDLAPGVYEFEITIKAVAAGRSSWFKPQPTRPLVFKMQAGQMDYRRFGGKNTMQMWAPDYQPTASEKP